jgi:hypothetical protein
MAAGRFHGPKFCASRTGIAGELLAPAVDDESAGVGVGERNFSTEITTRLPIVRHLPISPCHILTADANTRPSFVAGIASTETFRACARKVCPSSLPRGDRQTGNHSPRSALMLSDAESLTGIKHQQVSRWPLSNNYLSDFWVEATKNLPDVG